LVGLLAAEFDVVATAENGQAAVENIRQYRPDIVVLDLQMPLLSGIEVTQELKNIAPGAAVVICSVETDPEVVQACHQAGALGYVVKMFAARDLPAAVRAAARGEPFLSS
jgi:DNA-binding NarL/FixJ family response regulator